MTVVERIDQVRSLVIPFFYRLSLAGAIDAVALAVIVSALILYYAGWVRYIILERAEELFYRSLLSIPLPKVVMPVIYFLAADVLLDSVWLLLAFIALGVGHLTLSWLHSRSMEQGKSKKLSEFRRKKMFGFSSSFPDKTLNTDVIPFHQILGMSQLYFGIEGINDFFR